MESWQRLADHVRRERARRRLNQAEFAATIGLSARTVRQLEHGQPHTYASDTRIAVEDALRWAPGSFDRVTNGGRPRPEPDEQFARVRHAWPHLPAEIRDFLADTAERHARR